MKHYESQFKKLTDVGLVKRGKSKHRPRNAPELYGGPYPFVQTGDVKAADFFISSYTQTYSELGLAQSKLWQPGTLLITIAANIADTAILKIPACFPDSIIGFIPIEGKSDVRFVKYCLDTYKTQIQSISRGTTQDNLSQGKLLSLRFRIPDYEQQRKIAAILSAYDELIENNKRRIALLEKVAEEIYREWFVCLRFPGYQKAAKIKGVPKGWEVLAFSEVVSINPPERLDKSEDSPYVGMEDLSVRSLFFRSNAVRKGGQGSKFRNRDVLFPRITPSVENGKRGFVLTLKDGQVGLGSTEFIVLREKVIGAEHIYFLTCSSDFRKHAELSMTGASGRQRVQEECFAFFLVKTPPAEIRRQFSDLVRPNFSEIHLLSEQIDKLTRSRDSLLPRLISGKLSVEDLNIQFPPGMIEELDQNSDVIDHA